MLRLLTTNLGVACFYYHVFTLLVGAPHPLISKKIFQNFNVKTIMGHLKKLVTT
jgi:hypothetical protein